MIQAVRGTRDILPEEAQIWRQLEEAAWRTFRLYGYGEIRTPIFEKSALFARAVGETTDIVEKEMYTFLDRNQESLCLRPEGTASVVRAFIENGLHHKLPWRVFYRGPMFRYERPQKGRYRQFYQIGCELFGSEGPLADGEMLLMIGRFLREINLLSSVRFELNSLGCHQCRTTYRDYLTQALGEQKQHLCEHCQDRLQRNPLRILDCKVEACRAIAQNAPLLRDHRCLACANHFAGVMAIVSDSGLEVIENPHLVRGLDYYTRTAFEVTTDRLGAQNAVVAGGRYDHLVAHLGGTSVPAIGFAMGVERLALLMAEQTAVMAAPAAYLVTLGDAAIHAGVRLVESLRQQQLWVEIDLAGGSMKSQMKRAARSQAPFTLILGDTEVASQQVQLKNMATGEQTAIPLTAIAAILAQSGQTSP